MEESEKNTETCKLCGGTKCLTQSGILKVYLLSWKTSLFMIAVGILLAILHSVYWLALSVLGYILPLASADLRLLLYPYVAILSLMGKKANCPKCEPACSIFRAGE
jgi:hypothetical protein